MANHNVIIVKTLPTTGLEFGKLKVCWPWLVYILRDTMANRQRTEASRQGTEASRQGTEACRQGTEASRQGTEASR